MLCAIGVWGRFHHLSQSLQQQICWGSCTGAVLRNLKQEIHVGKRSGPVNNSRHECRYLRAHAIVSLRLSHSLLDSNVVFKAMHKPVTQMQCHHKPANNDGSLPARHQPRHIVHNNRFSEDCAIQNVSDGAIWTPPHLLEFELLHSCLIWCNCGAFDAHSICLRHACHRCNGFASDANTCQTCLCSVIQDKQDYTVCYTRTHATVSMHALCVLDNCNSRNRSADSQLAHSYAWHSAYEYLKACLCQCMLK